MFDSCFAFNDHHHRPHKLQSMTNQRTCFGATLLWLLGLLLVQTRQTGQVVRLAPFKSLKALLAHLLDCIIYLPLCHTLAHSSKFAVNNSFSLALFIFPSFYSFLFASIFTKL